MKPVLVILLLVCVLLAVTNPSMEAFRDFIRTEVAVQMVRDGDGILVDISQAINQLIGVDPIGSATDYMFRNATRTDYVIMSRYAVIAPNGRRLDFIGILGRFFSN